MKYWLALIALLATSAAANVEAGIITFDDYVDANAASVDPLPDVLAMSNPHQGFDFSNFVAVRKTALGTPPTNAIGPGLFNGVVDEYGAVNGFGDPGALEVVSGGDLFTFNSVLLTAVFTDDLEILVEGFVGGLLTHFQTVAVDTSGPTFTTFDFVGIDTLKFTSSSAGGGETHFVMDNLTYNEAVSPVPEPSSLALLGMGALGLVGCRCRRKSGVTEKGRA